MAISTLNRLSSQFNRLPSLSPFTKSLLTRSFAKVADRIVKLSAIDPDGQKREIVGLSGQTLLKALANNGLIDPASHRLEEIEACSAECEVNIAQEWLERLPPRSYDEEYVLKRNSRARVLNKHSRLSCQVVLTQDLQGMVVAVPELSLGIFRNLNVLTLFGIKF
jgi:ferredoxin